MIKVETAVVVQGGKVMGLRHRWTFDKAYLTSILEEYDANRNRRIDGTELAKLVANTRSTLRHFGAFTVAWRGKRKLKMGHAGEIEMTFDKDIPVLEFSLDLAKPARLSADDFRLEVYDATYFSAFAFAGPSAVTFTGDPQSRCSLRIEASPSTEQRAAYRAFVREFGMSAAKRVVPSIVVADCAGHGKGAEQAASSGGPLANPR